MCRLIYKVLTSGPERISMLLGKCFPLGLLSATAYRCEGWAFPAMARMKKKRPSWVPLQPVSERVNYNLSPSALCWALPSGPQVPLMQGCSLRPHLDSLYTLFATDLSGWQFSSERWPNRTQTTLHGPVSIEHARKLVREAVYPDDCAWWWNENTFVSHGHSQITKVSKKWSQCCLQR